jgi:hypothetical protein
MPIICLSAFKRDRHIQHLPPLVAFVPQDHVTENLENSISSTRDRDCSLFLLKVGRKIYIGLGEKICVYS